MIKVSSFFQSVLDMGSTLVITFQQSFFETEGQVPCPWTNRIGTVFPSPCPSKLPAIPGFYLLDFVYYPLPSRAPALSRFEFLGQDQGFPLKKHRKKESFLLFSAPTLLYVPGTISPLSQA